jgi:hypothetical protein
MPDARHRACLMRAAALAVALCALGCVVFSRHPIRGELPRELDPELAGEWVSIENGQPDPEREIFTFESHGDHYVASSAGSPEVLEVTTARLGGHRYLSVLQLGEESTGFTLVRYEVREDRVALAWMDYDAARQLVDSGRLRGAVEELPEEEGDQGQSRRPMLYLSSSTSELESYLLASGPLALFPELIEAWTRPPPVSDASARGSRGPRTSRAARAEHREADQARAQ